MLREIERFFMSYNERNGIRFSCYGRAGRAAARRLFREGQPVLAAWSAAS